jgi:ABC-type Na+ efflux pump permease subunit
MGTGWSALQGATVYEFRMQLRRRAVWITPVVLSLIAFGFTGWDASASTPLTEAIVGWAQEVQTLLPIGVGVLLADRLPRDRRTGVGELLATTPASSGGRLVGKFLGATFATIVPILAIYAVGVGGVLGERREWGGIPLALAAFAAVNLPGLLFVGAFSIACPALLWVPLYQFLFVGYWFWGNALSPDQGIPTLNGTLLTPIGDYMAAGLFGVPGLSWVAEASPRQGALSILLLLASAAVALAAAHAYLRWRQARV